MAQKHATPSRVQQEYIKAEGLHPDNWAVLKELSRNLIIKHRITEEVRVISKMKAQMIKTRKSRPQW